VGTTSSGVVGSVATVLTLAGAFFFDFPAADLGAAIDLGSGFLGLAVILLAVTLGCSRLPSQVHAVSFYPDFSRSACSAIGQNKLTCDWSEQAGLRLVGLTSDGC
jgi:hypothetical protein